MENLNLIHTLIYDEYELIPEDIFGIYLFGSRIYQTHSETSDFDYILITFKDINNKEIKHPIANIHIYNLDYFKEELNNCQIQFLEIFFKQNTC
jgi:predicted nucleotidyltransferase